MGGIDLDPASSAIANERVNAAIYFTKEHNGLSLDWCAKVWFSAHQCQEITLAITRGLELEKTPSLDRTGQSDALNAAKPTYALLISSTQKAFPPMAAPFGANPALDRTPLGWPQKNEQRMAARPTVRLKENIALQKPELITSEPDQLLITRNDALDDLKSLVYGAQTTGPYALIGGTKNAHIAQVVQNLQLTTSSRWLTRTAPEPLSQTSFQLARDVTHQKALSLLRNGAETSQQLSASLSMSEPLPARVFLNHPFSRAGNKLWIKKAVEEYAAGRAEQVCLITFASTSEQWFRPLLSFPNCFLQPRTNYLLPDGSIKRGVTKGSVVTYLGRNVRAFKDAFYGLGVIKI